MKIKGNVRHFQYLNGKKFDTHYIDVEITKDEIYEILENKVLKNYISGYVDNVTITSIEMD